MSKTILFTSILNIISFIQCQFGIFPSRYGGRIKSFEALERLMKNNFAQQSNEEDQSLQTRINSIAGQNSDFTMGLNRENKLSRYQSGIPNFDGLAPFSSNGMETMHQARSSHNTDLSHEPEMMDNRMMENRMTENNMMENKMMERAPQQEMNNFPDRPFNTHEAGSYNGGTMQEGQDEQSVQDLLSSFEKDDTRGNYFHHGQHGDYKQTSGSFQEDILNHEIENPESRQIQYNSPDYLVTKEVQLFLQYGNVPLGRVLIGLFGNTAPKTVANFADLADHTYGFGYRNSIFHRIIKDFMVQGGDITNGDGTGGRSIFGGQFPDENFKIKMNGPGWVCMANAGKDTNDSQFFITTADTPWLNGHHVCFGKVLEGMDIINRIQNVPEDSNNRPYQPVRIGNSNSIRIDPPFEASSDPARF